MAHFPLDVYNLSRFELAEGGPDIMFLAAGKSKNKGAIAVATFPVLTFGLYGVKTMCWPCAAKRLPGPELEQVAVAPLFREAQDEGYYRTAMRLQTGYGHRCERCGRLIFDVYAAA